MRFRDHLKEAMKIPGIAVDIELDVNKKLNIFESILSKYQVQMVKEVKK